MASPGAPMGVGIIGPARSMQHLREQLSLRRDFACVASHLEGNAPWKLSADDQQISRCSASDVIGDPRTQIVYFTGDPTETEVTVAISAKKHVVLETPVSIAGAGLRRLAELAKVHGVVVVTHQRRYWSEDFFHARHAVCHGLTGRLLRVRLGIHEIGLPGDDFPNGVLRDIGFHWLDQLLALVDDSPQTVYLRRFVASGESLDNGFLAVIDFDKGASAVIELQTRSLFSVRTGWHLEGENGVYRSGRTYKKTSDGEIVDEPLPASNASADHFFDALSAAIHRQDADSKLLPELTQAARVMELIERLEQTAS